MRLIRTLTAAIALLVLISSCALLERARMYGVEAAGRAVALECSLSHVERQKNLDGVNGWLLANDVKSRAVALDCDGDGSPDL